MRRWARLTIFACLVCQAVVGHVQETARDSAQKIELIRPRKLQLHRTPDANTTDSKLEKKPAASSSVPTLRVPGRLSPLTMPGLPPERANVNPSETANTKGTDSERDIRVMPKAARVTAVTEQPQSESAIAKIFRPKRKRFIVPPVAVGTLNQVAVSPSSGSSNEVAAKETVASQFVPQRHMIDPPVRLSSKVDTISTLQPVEAPEIAFRSPSIHVERAPHVAKPSVVQRVAGPLPKVGETTATQRIQSNLPLATTTKSGASAFLTDSKRRAGGVVQAAGEEGIVVLQPSSNGPATDTGVRTSPQPVAQPNNQPRLLKPAPVTPLPNRQTIQLQSPPTLSPVEYSTDPRTGLKSLAVTGRPLPEVLRSIADDHRLSLVLGPQVSGNVTASISGAELQELLDAILGVSGFSSHRVGNLLYVTSAKNTEVNPRIQGRRVQSYTLNYVSAGDVEAVANRLLSPVGNAFITEAAQDDQMKTRESLVVDDTEEAHVRISQYISQIDIPPRQVLVEAHVLQIALSDDDRHGVNLSGLARLNGTRLELAGTGFADSNVNGPSLALRVDGTDMDSLIELIRQNTNSRTLASPKVSVINHQEARIQIGQRLPYAVATTTQTSTVQSVEFLEVGIVLTVEPVITQDGNVLMTVSPKVSGGRITENGFPEEDTTELSTSILMPDGGGIVIGGLIREEQTQTRSLVPGIGKVPVVGHLFQRRTNESRRNELVVALVTHVLPDVNSARSHELQELNCTLPEYARRELREPHLQLQPNRIYQHTEAAAQSVTAPVRSANGPKRHVTKGHRR